MGRRSRATALKLLVIAVCVITLVWLQRQPGPLVPQIDEASLKHALTDRYHKSDELRSISISDKTYDAMIDRIPLSSLVALLDFEDRCDLYFRTLLLEDPNWFIEPTESFPFDKKFFDKYADYEKKMFNKYRKEQEKQGNTIPESSTIPKELKEKWLKEYKAKWKNIVKDEQKLHNIMSHLRIYNKCYVEHDVNATVHHQPTADPLVTAFNDSSYIGFQREIIAPLNVPKIKYRMKSHFKQFSSCREMESKLYPWLTSKFPVYKRWDNVAVVDEVPQLTHVVPKPAQKHRSSFSKDAHRCFLNQFKNGLNGRGLVLTISDSHLDMTIRLIRLLRVLGNQLPIQIVHLKELEYETRYQLTQASRTEFEGHPKQDLWFVDVSGAVKEEYYSKFDGFGNKILATMFNSFAEMILLDADTVLMKNPEFFFGLKKYVKTGTMFYKDRDAIEFRPKNDIIFFKRMLPSIMDTVLFNIPQVTDYTLKRQFFQGKNHYMESGLVIINRSIHFSMPLLMAQLNFYHPVQARVYGDKELFWLALAISGNENYAFNDHFAAAIGTITPNKERYDDHKEGKPLRSKEICSNHPAHISDEDNKSLLWFNSGFRHCGQCDKVDFKKEFAYKRRYTRLSTLAQFKAFFTNKLDIRHAVIPPSDTVNADNEEGESNMPWLGMGGYCHGYTWCGYSLIGGAYTKDGETRSNQQDGILIKFSDQEIRKFNTLGDAWVSTFDYRSPGKVELDNKLETKKETEEFDNEKAIMKALNGPVSSHDNQWWLSE